MMNRETGTSRGFGFITFEKTSDCAKDSSIFDFKTVG